MRTLAGKNDHASRSALNAACGGLWMNDRRSRVYEEESLCTFCQGDIGIPKHVLFDCPAFCQQRKEAHVGTFREDVPECVQIDLWVGEPDPPTSPHHCGNSRCGDH
eukprot:5028837-Amphidinium_carterae.3